MKGVVAVFFFFFSILSFSAGDYPFRVDWKYVETPVAKVIYPRGLKKQAERIANTVNYIDQNKPHTIGKKSRKIDIILQSDQVIGNGYVGLFPFRSSFFSTSPQNAQSMTALNWIDALSIHEYRHVLQFSNTINGVSKWAYVLMGELGTALFSGLAVPNWFWEGDAVLSETLLSNSGRGRSPYFSKEQRALLFSERRLYDYEKARNGSLKDLVPSHYPLGYVMCNYVRNHYGSNVWKKAFSDAISYRGVFYPFSTSLKNSTGYSTRELYKKSYQELKDRYANYLKSISLTKTNRITSTPKTVTDYRFAHSIDSGGVVALKESYQDTPQVIWLKGGQEKVLTRVGIQIEPFMSVTGDKVLWTELETNLRRGNENYHALVVYDITSGKKRYIKSKTKFFSPHHAHMTDRIALVEVTNQMQNRINIVDSKNGTLLSQLANKENDFISYPRWTKDDEYVVYVAKRGSKLSVLKQRVRTGQVEQLMPWTSHAIGSLALTDSRVYFSASFNGIDNIYSVDLMGKQELKQITSVIIGAYMPFVSDDMKTLFFSEYTDRGYQLSKLPIHDFAESVRITEPAAMSVFNVKTDAASHDILDEIPDQVYDEHDYSSFIKEIRPYSWGIGFASNNYLQAFMNFRDVFENWDLGVGYIQPSSEYKQYYTGISYSRLFPILSLGFNRIERDGDDPESYVPLNNLKMSGYSENLLSAGAKIPLTRYHGNNVQTLTLSSTLYHRDVSSRSLSLYSMENQIELSHATVQAVQHIFPRWGIGGSLTHSKSITSSYPVEKIDIEAFGYLPPRLIPNDGFKITGQYMNMLSRTDGYSFPNAYVVSRGISSVTTSLLDGFKKFTADYVFPIAYPDVGAGGLFYMNRLRMGTFYDYAETNYVNASVTKQTYQLTGVTLSADGTLFNILPVSVNITGSYYLQNPNPSDNQYEITVGLSTILGAL